MGKTSTHLWRGSHSHVEKMYFSNHAKSSFLSKKAYITFSMIPRGFTHEDFKIVKTEIYGASARGYKNITEMKEGLMSFPTKSLNVKDFLIYLFHLSNI